MGGTGLGLGCVDVKQNMGGFVGVFRVGGFNINTSALFWSIGVTLLRLDWNQIRSRSFGAADTEIAVVEPRREARSLKKSIVKQCGTPQ